MDQDYQVLDIKSIKMTKSLKNNCIALLDLQDWIDSTIGLDTPYKAYVESQEVYKGQGHKQKSIIKLANYAGIAASAMALAGRCVSVDFILPKEWTNQEKKRKQYWTCKKLGLTPDVHRTYTVPKEGLCGEHRATVLADIMDAVGIAFHVAEKHNLAVRRQEILDK
jgi:hypothetical protein